MASSETVVSCPSRVRNSVRGTPVSFQGLGRRDSAYGWSSAYAERLPCALAVRSSRLSLSYFGHRSLRKVSLPASTPSAEEHSRLLRDHADATEQFRATNEVLTALGRSTSDPDAVLDTVVESARRLCRGNTAAIYLIEGGIFRLASSVGLSHEFVRNWPNFPMEVNRGTVIGRAAVERRVQKVSDVLTDTEYMRSDVQQ